MHRWNPIEDPTHTTDPEHALSKTLAEGVQGDHVAFYGYSDGNFGLYGGSDTSDGVYGTSVHGRGVHGEVTTGTGAGVYGKSSDGIGVHAISGTYEAIHAETNSSQTAAIAAYNTNPDGPAALYARKAGKGHAGFFEGELYTTSTLTVDGDVNLREGSIHVMKGDVILESADCAEEFDVAPESAVEPGTVMVLTAESRVSESAEAYDSRVAGVVSGAGAYKPAIILDRQKRGTNRHPIALLGKVYCKVDAAYGAVRPGDLLTTSPTPGHAMKVDDPLRAFGAVLGKALATLDSGRALVPVLVTLR